MNKTRLFVRIFLPASTFGPSVFFMRSFLSTDALFGA
jgi:hypothetical protein